MLFLLVPDVRIWIKCASWGPKINQLFAVCGPNYMGFQKEKILYSTCQFGSRLITLKHNTEGGYNIKG